MVGNRVRASRNRNVVLTLLNEVIWCGIEVVQLSIWVGILLVLIFDLSLQGSWEACVFEILADDLTFGSLSWYCNWCLIPSHLIRLAELAL